MWAYHIRQWKSSLLELLERCTVTGRSSYKHWSMVYDLRSKTDTHLLCCVRSWRRKAQESRKETSAAWNPLDAVNTPALSLVAGFSTDHPASLSQYTRGSRTEILASQCSESEWWRTRRCGISQSPVGYPTPHLVEQSVGWIPGLIHLLSSMGKIITMLKGPTIL